VGLLGQPVDDFALPLVPPLGTNHDHIGHAAAFLRVADARDSLEATKACPAFGPSPDHGHTPPGRVRPPRRTDPSAAQPPDFAGLIHPLPSRPANHSG